MSQLVTNSGLSSPVGTPGSEPPSVLAVVPRSAYELVNEILAQIAGFIVDKADEAHTLAESSSNGVIRLFSLIGSVPTLCHCLQGLAVYLKDDIESFSVPNGSIRISSRCMDIFDDEELIFVVGRELAHAILGHSMALARLKVLAWIGTSGAAQDDSLGRIMTGSQLGKLATAYLGSAYSLEQEVEADAWAVQCMRQNGLDLAAPITAMRKLAPPLSSSNALFAERFHRVRLAIFPDALANI